VKWVGVIFMLALLAYLADRLDRLERNRIRWENRSSLRKQAHEEMQRINFLYPSG
jgi:hypothetical protein